MKYLLLLTLLFTVACEKESEYLYHDELPDRQYGSRTMPMEYLFSDNRIDVLWVVDNSGSMSDIQQNIVRNSAVFMESFLGSTTINWKMGVISTDKSENPFLGFNEAFDTNYLIKHGKEKTQRDFENAINSLGTNGSATEYVFYNITNKFTQYKDFLTPGAHLAVIMVSDEEEQSQDGYGAGYTAMNFLSQVTGFIDDGKQIRFYGALSARDLEGCRWGPNYANSPFEQIIDETGGFNVSACIDFGERLGEIAKDIINMSFEASITLKHRPKLDSIRVVYEGKDLPVGPEAQGGVWTYSEQYNTIDFYNLDFAMGSDVTGKNLKVYYQIHDGYDRDPEE
jgi:hypothetical protein